MTVKRAVWLLLALAACRQSAHLEAPKLSLEQVRELLPDKVTRDREGWATDLLAALEANELPPTAHNVCAVVAVVEQESGFQADPGVPNLPSIARAALTEKAEKAGPLGQKLLDEVLKAKAPGQSRTFEQRLGKLRTEKDLDLFFRDLLAEQKRQRPIIFAAANLASELMDQKSLADRNPITTAGSMQVSVQFSVDHPLSRGKSENEVRDLLYSRGGGMLYGAARLLGFEAGYDQMQYRFADYNAGFYSSRNAALQEQLSALTKQPLALDGDLLAWEDEDTVRSTETKTMAALEAFADAQQPVVSHSQVERDARKEKTRELEKTWSWKAVRKAYEQAKGKPAAYARLPEVTLHSPKFKSRLTTAWFAKNVDRRFQACLQRAGVDAP